MFGLVIALLLSASVLHQAHAQEGREPRKSPALEWFALSIGAGFPEDVNVGFSYSFGRTRLYQLAINHSADINIFGPPGKSLTSSSFSVGLRTAMPFALAAIFAGPAFVIVDGSDNKVEEDRRFTGGIVVNPQLYLRPFADIGTVGGIPLAGLGVGLDLYGNLNLMRSTCGVRLGLYLGTSK